MPRGTTGCSQVLPASAGYSCWSLGYLSNDASSEQVVSILLTTFLECWLVASVLLRLCVDCSGCVKCICCAGLIFESDDHLFDASNVSVVSEVANGEYPVGDECAGCEGMSVVFKIF